MPGAVGGWPGRWISYALVSAGFIMESSLRGPVLSPDSVGYLAGAVGRPPVYPLWLAIFRPLPTEIGLAVIVFLQTAFVLVAAAVLVLNLRRIFGLHWLTEGFSFLLLGLPLLGGRGIGSAILTESIAYGLLLLAWSAILLFLARERVTFLVWGMLAWLLALLTRPQLLFFAAAFLPLVIWSWRQKKLSSLFLVALFFAGTVVSARLVERGYNFLRHGSVLTRPVTGLQFATPLFYLAGPEDINLLLPEDRPYFSKVIERIREGRWHRDFYQSPNFLRSSQHYIDNWNHICYQGMFNAFLEEKDIPAGTDLLSLEPELVMALNERLWRIAWPLYRKYILDHFRLVLVSMLFIMGGMTYPVLLAASAMIAGIVYWRWGNLLALGMTGVLSLHGLNYAASATMNSLMLRYTFYTDVLVLVHLILLLADWAVRIRANSLQGEGNSGPAG